MKYFLNSVAIAAVLAISVPALAQTQGSGHRPARPKAAHAATGHHHASHASSAHHRGHAVRSVTTTSVRGERGSASDNVANQLNGQELQRLETSPAPPMAAQSVARPGPGPRSSGGGYIQAGPGGPLSNANATDEGPKTSGGGYIPAPTGPLPMPPRPPISSPTR